MLLALAAAALAPLLSFCLRSTLFGGKWDNSVACLIRPFMQAAALSASRALLCPLGLLCESQSSSSLPLMSLSGSH